jgi:hypothetical protein
MYLIGDTNPNWIDVIESIQIRDSDLIDSVDHARVTSCHGVEPATSALASRCRAKLASQIMQHLCQLRVLGGQSSLAHARGVRLHHAYHAVHPMRWHTGACAGAARRRV